MSATAAPTVPVFTERVGDEVRATLMAPAPTLALHPLMPVEFQPRTLVVNIYGGPGTGKSTTAAGVFYDLKQAGVNCELAHEYAKDLTWEKAVQRLSFQPGIAAEQMWRIERLIGQVEVVITDSPIIFCTLYARDSLPPAVREPFEDFLRAWHESHNTLDVFLNRDPNRYYNAKGRNQSEDEAKEIDTAILDKLDEWGVPFFRVPMQSGKQQIVSTILQQIEHSNAIHTFKLECTCEGSPSVPNEHHVACPHYIPF